MSQQRCAISSADRIYAILLASPVVIPFLSLHLPSTAAPFLALLPLLVGCFHERFIARLYSVEAASESGNKVRAVKESSLTSRSQEIVKSPLARISGIPSAYRDILKQPTSPPRDIPVKKPAQHVSSIAYSSIPVRPRKTVQALGLRLAAPHPPPLPIPSQRTPLEQLEDLIEAECPPYRKIATKSRLAQPNSQPLDPTFRASEEQQTSFFKTHLRPTALPFVPTNVIPGRKLIPHMVSHKTLRPTAPPFVPGAVCGLSDEPIVFYMTGQTRGKENARALAA